MLTLLKKNPSKYTGNTCKFAIRIVIIFTFQTPLFGTRKKLNHDISKSNKLNFQSILNPKQNRIPLKWLRFFFFLETIGFFLKLFYGLICYFEIRIKFVILLNNNV